MAPQLLIFHNADEEMRQPYRMLLPASLDTMAELCKYVSQHMPPPPQEQEPFCTYRFLYSATGRPLWRVRECIDAETIIIAADPGFRARRPGDAPRAAIDISPPAELLSARTASPSPPHPTPRHSANHDLINNNEVDVHQYRDRLSITLSSPYAGRGDAPHTADAFVASHTPRDAYTPHSSPQPRRAVANDDDDDDDNDAVGRRGVVAPDDIEVMVDGRGYVLPRPPIFLAQNTPTTHMCEESLEDDAEIATRLHIFCARKWRAFATLRRQRSTSSHAELPLTKVKELVQRARRQRYGGADTTTAASTNSTNTVGWRVVVHGPPQSGTSTTCANIVGEMIYDFSRGRALHQSLLLPLDVASFVDPQLDGLTSLDALRSRGTNNNNTNKKKRSDVEGSLTIPHVFQVVVRAVMDAVTILRPQLRQHASIMAELWERVLRHACSASDDERCPIIFTSFAQIAALVGHHVLEQWGRWAAQAYPLLKQACGSHARGAASAEVRAAALRLIIASFPATIAASLRFSGVVVVLDALHLLQTRDASAVMKAVWEQPHTHVVCAWPTTMIPSCLYLPPPTEWVKMIGCISPTELKALAFPKTIVCRGVEHPLTMFLGCPGYIAALQPLVRAAAASLDRQRSSSPDFSIRIHSEDAARALQSLQQVVASYG